MTHGRLTPNDAASLPLARVDHVASRGELHDPEEHRDGFVRPPLGSLKLVPKLPGIVWLISGQGGDLLPDPRGFFGL